MTVPAVQITLAADPNNPCAMCVLKNRKTVHFELLSNGDRPKPPPGGCFVHGAYRCPHFGDDLQALNAARPELELDMAALTQRIDPLAIYKAHCVKSGVVPKLVPNPRA